VASQISGLVPVPPATTEISPVTTVFPSDGYDQEWLQSRADAALIEQIALGNEQAIVVLYDRYSALVYSIALRILRNPVFAEDVLREIFMYVWRTPANVATTRGTLAGWMAVGARNRSIDVLRARNLQEVGNELLTASAMNLGEEAKQDLIVTRARLFIEQLPFEQRKMLEMAFFEGMTPAEIAELTGIRLENVMTQIRTALESLRLSVTSKN
jgi:RNA polymerase sigma-70 factor (ECF subfamily)